MAKAATRPRESRSEQVDYSLPAGIVVTKFGGLKAFCALTGYATSTVWGWLVKGLIPIDHVARIKKAGVDHKIKLSDSDFIPSAAA